MCKNLIIIICIVYFESGFITAGQKVTVISADKNGFTLRADFESAAAEVHTTNGLQRINFPEAVDESKPGTPMLPSKTVFIALPPNTKITAALKNVQKYVYSNSQPSANPKIVLNADSTISSQPMNLNTALIAGDRYPASDIEILDYVWLGNYYCAAVRINTHSYQPGTNHITEVQRADLSISYQNIQTSFRKNFTPLSSYEQDLKDVILNYDAAKEFRSFHATALPPDTSGGWIDYTKQYIKLSVPADGIYRITYNDLQSYGVNLAGLDPKTFRLFEGGREVPLYVNGEGDGVFDTTDYAEFYGTKHYGSKNYRTIVPQKTDYLNYMDRYSDTSIVWLTWGGSSGLRTVLRDGSGSSSDTVQSTLTKLHLEKDLRLWYYDVVDPRSQLPFWQEHKIWSWLFFNPGTITTVPFTANSVLPGTLCTTTFRLIANGTDAGNASSKMGIGFNSTTIAEGDTFAYRKTVNFQPIYASSRLKEGSNSIKVQGMTGGTYQFLIDWIDIDYYRYTKAVNDSLVITIPDSAAKAYRTIKVTGLTASNLLIYKVSPAVTRIINYSVSGASQKTCTFADSVSGGDQYYIVSESKARTPGFVVKKQFENLRNPNRGADYIIVSNKILKNSAAAYNNFIQSNYPVRTHLAYVDDIYDEFYFGYNHPEAIRDFLVRANTQWQPPAPSYLLLIGEANYDYKNVTTGLLHIKPNLVPSYGDPVSDVWYTTWDSLQADIPQMYVGRIPAETDADVNFYLQKHQAYLQKPFDEWNKTFLFFSGGDPNTAGQIDQIRNANNNVYTSLALAPPVGGKGVHFYKTTNPTSNFGPYTTQQIQDAVQSGSLLISYIGHSGTQTWDNGITAVSDLKNIYSNRYPLISDFGCSTGKFAEPDIDCFGELFVSQDRDGQAISYFGNTSLGYLSTATNFPMFFYTKLLKDTVTVVGKAHLLAKIRQLQLNGFNDVNRVFTYCNTLFGDPIVNLAVPRKPNLVLDNQSLSLAGNIPTEADDSVSLKIVTKNLGLKPLDSILVSVTDKINGSVAFSRSFKISPSTFWDTTLITIPVKNRVGEHVITVVADSANVINEMSEGDNTASMNFAVYSVNLRSLEQSSYYNSIRNSLKLINPIYKIRDAAERIRLSLDTTETFVTAIEFTKDFDTITTEISLPALKDGQRYWWRAKIDQPQFEWSTPSSFVASNNPASWFAETPRTANDFLYDKTTFNQQTKNWELLSGISKLKISSAGTSAGSFVSVEYNGSEKSPNTFFWGIVTAKIDSITLQPYEFRYFLYPTPPSADSLINYINRLPNGTLLAMSICDDGAQSVLGFNGGTLVRKAIEQLGSYYVDSVRYRESWCILGKKGAPKGSVPESYKKQYEGVASIVTQINARPDSGVILFPQIGVASSWDSLTLNMLVPAGSKIDIVPLGLKSTNQIDTLSALDFSTPGKASLSQINASTYPSVKLAAKLYSNANKETPHFGNVSVYYKKVPELAMNYQVVGTYKADRISGTNTVTISGIKSDTVGQGKYLGIQGRVYNISQTTAKNVKVQSIVIWDDNRHEDLDQVVFDSIVPGTYKDVKLIYNSSAGIGRRRLQIEIDPDNSVREFYRDNNIYSSVFVVVPDTAPPPLPNLAIDPNSIFVPSNISNIVDSTAVTMIVRNEGSARYDSVDVRVTESYQLSVIKTWNIRMRIPVLAETLVVYADVKGKAGDHQITVEIDPLSKIIESSKNDNSASKNFFVTTTDFTILQPDQFNTSYISHLILLNPSSEPWDGVKKILLDVDTVSTFPAATRFKTTLGQFSTTFDISSLKRLTRYWWRAKVENGVRDWTVGTFFMGDSSERTIGQSDSVSWVKGKFIHAAYSNANGAHIEDTPERFRLVSAGYADGGFAVLEFNGKNLIVNAIDTCHFLAVFDPNYALISFRRFNLFADPAQADSLAQFVSAVSAGNYVVAVINGEGSNNFTTSARNAYKLIGSKDADLIGWRDSWAIIGKKGAIAGTVPELYHASGLGKVELDTTFFKHEESGTIITEKFGPVTSWKKLVVQSIVQPGAAINLKVIGIASNGVSDTIISVVNPQVLDVQNVSAKQYPYGKLLFTLTRNASGNSPMIQQWNLAALPPAELALSQKTISVEKPIMNEGEIVNLALKIFNAGGTNADSVTAAILTDDDGFPRTLLRAIIPTLNAGDSSLVQVQYDSRGKRGSHLFFFRINPDTTIPELDMTNNSFSVGYTIVADTLKPSLFVTVDGGQVVNGDYVSSNPEIIIRYKDSNPSVLTMADTSIFSIQLNNERVHFIPGILEMQLPGSPGEARVRWTPALPDGENIFQISASDISGNNSDTTTVFVNVSSKLELRDVYTIPNPFAGSTHFTFNLTGAAIPDFVSIKIYTVAGRLIQDISAPAKVGFNKIFWDGRDKDGDEVGNGLYLYKITVHQGEKQTNSISKLVKMK